MAKKDEQPLDPRPILLDGDNPYHKIPKNKPADQEDSDVPKSETVQEDPSPPQNTKYSQAAKEAVLKNYPLSSTPKSKEQLAKELGISSTSKLYDLVKKIKGV